MATPAFRTARLALLASCPLAILLLLTLAPRPVPDLRAGEHHELPPRAPQAQSDDAITESSTGGRGSRRAATTKRPPFAEDGSAGASPSRDPHHNSVAALRLEKPAEHNQADDATSDDESITATAPVTLDPNLESAATLSAPADTTPETAPRVTFRWIEPIAEPSPPPAAAPANARLEAQLTSLQQQVERLAHLQSERQTHDLERATRAMEQMRQTAHLQNLEDQIRQMHVAAENSAAAAVQSAAGPADRQPPTADPIAPGPVLRAHPAAGDPERFSLQIQDAEIAQVLDMLGQMTGRNIVVGRDVTGKVSANLKDVSLDQALAAVLRSGGYVYEREQDFVFVMTPAEADARKRLTRKVITKVYRPHYISVKELQSLITPLQTEGIGKIAVTTPAENGIASNADEAGGDRLSQQDALLVQDYAEIINEIDAVVMEMDVPPLQVVIEAMILSVTLSDELQYGVNFALLGGSNKDLFVSGNGQTLNNSSRFPGTAGSILPPAAEFIANTAGLKYGFIRGDIAAFIEALEEISDTNLIASPQLRVLNKQKAELIIGDRISYKTLAFNGTQTVENVNFLDSGTRLILRPFIAPDGLIRMEIHPERSSAVIDPITELPNQATTEVTTNVMVRDGTTAVIGGLIAEEVVESQQRIPYLGALPVVGNVFKNKTERIDRTELIVLITPRIVVEPEAVAEDEAIRIENERRADWFRDNLSSHNRQNLARVEYERALYFYNRGEMTRAHVHVREALRHSKNDLEALRLKDVIETAMRDRNRRWLKMPAPFRQPGSGELPQEMTDDHVEAHAD